MRCRNNLREIGEAVKPFALTAFSALLLSLLLGGPTIAATAGTALQSIEPSTIPLGDSAQLTITSIGSDMPGITPPMVPGLEFLAVGQSQQVQIINGVTSVRSTVTYQVIPQQPGVFSIPSALPGAEPVVLTVTRGNGSAPGGAAPGASPQGGQPQASSSLPADSTRQGASGAAFVRLRLAKHELYVGEMVPVDIQVGARDGMVASLNGPPTLNGDAFTLSKLPQNPTRTEEVVDGKPFIVFTWHTALVAVKPGTLSLTIDTPLTVRVRTPGRPNAGFFGGSGFEDLFNDPAFQNFFGATTQRDVTVSSAPETFTVLALPDEGRPTDFSGAVGQFTVSTQMSQDKAGEGDPVTLRMRVSGEGDFDRVSSSMLHDVDGWKTYSPTANFKPADEIGYRGEKIFEQPLIALQPGNRTVPEVHFSWFDPSTRRYEQAHTEPLTVAVTPAPAGSSLASNSVPASAASPAKPAGNDAAPAWRPDHPDAGGGRTRSLMPHYFQPAFMTVPPLVVIALSTAWFWMRRSERSAETRRIEPSMLPPSVESLASELDQYAAAGDAQSFFGAARRALCNVLGLKWGVTPPEVTTNEVVSRLGSDSEITRAFMLADEAAYSTLKLTPPDFRQWKHVVLRNVDGEMPS
jgi:hypothetical protein